MCHSRTPRPPGSPPKSGVARCIRGKVIIPVPAKRVGQGVAAFAGAVGAEIAFMMVAWQLRHGNMG